MLCRLPLDRHSADQRRHRSRALLRMDLGLCQTQRWSTKGHYQQTRTLHIYSVRNRIDVIHNQEAANKRIGPTGKHCANQCRQEFLDLSLIEKTTKIINQITSKEVSKRTSKQSNKQRKDATRRAMCTPLQTGDLEILPIIRETETGNLEILPIIREPETG